MNIILLAGGKGTRLHPLTQDIPKPMVPVVNRPWLHHLVEIVSVLSASNIRCAVHYRWEIIRDVLLSRVKGGVPIELVLEREALGTGGAIKNAAQGIDETFLVLNADIVPGIDLRDLLRFHRDSGAVCTIALTRVEDPSAYGAVELSKQAQVLRFIEKPAPGKTSSNLVNAGIYIMEPKVLDYIPAGRAVSIEREVFPKLISDGLKVCGFASDAYWNDIGTRSGYLRTHWDILNGRMALRFPDSSYMRDPGQNIWVAHGVHVEPGARLVGPIFIGEGCMIRSGATVGPRAVLGPHVKVNTGAVIRDSVIWSGAHIGANSLIEECVVGFNTIIEDSRTARAELIRSHKLWENSTTLVTV
ncbi:MAG: NDP-sugar synthase [Firmicutes bacterium]|nr:NDP-sugar synthase [Bacillota bacterium]